MRLRVDTVATGLAVAAVAPYIGLKVLWLSGSTIGLRTEAAVDELHSARMVTGNVITIGLELLALGLIAALTRPWGRRAPAQIVLVPAGGATGLLAPILLGLPVGAVLQLVFQGDLRTAGMHDMAWWVFAAVYGGFGVLAVIIAALAGRYAVARWADVLDRAPRPPAPWLTAVGAVGMLPFAAAMLWWGIAGPGSTGPPQMEAVSQRVPVAVTGLVVLAGFLAPLRAAASAQRPRLTWLALWVGCTTAALQGPTEMLLANQGHPSRVMVVLGLLAVPCAAGYGLGILRAERVGAGTRQGYAAEDEHVAGVAG